MSQRHTVFLSYHHANDQAYKQIFDNRFGNVEDIIVRGSVEMGDIDERLSTEPGFRTLSCALRRAA